MPYIVRLADRRSGGPFRAARTATLDVRTERVLHLDPEPANIDTDGSDPATVVPPAGAPSAGQLSFAIAIPTYRRPEQLARLLASFQDLAWPASWRFGGVLVVDNDPDGSARAVVEAHREAASWPVRYVVEPTAGVVAARNRAVREASHVSHVAMVDDDEVVEPGWPAGLLEVAERTGAELTGGLVIPQPEAEVPAWMLQPAFLGRVGHPDGAAVRRVTSGNALINRNLLADGTTELFDPRFGRTGGEDSHLSAVVRSRGGQVRWSATARTVEVVPVERCSLAWLQRRWRRTGATMVLVELALAGSRRQRLQRRARALVVGSGRVLYGATAVGRTGAARASRLRQCMQGLGQVAGALGSTPVAYGPGGFESPS